MKHTLILLSLSVLCLVLSNCKHEVSKEEAQRYYASFSHTIDPYKTSSETIMSEAKEIIGHQYSFSDLTMFSQDSMRLRRLFNDFNALQADTKHNIDTLAPFEPFDLKQPALSFIDSTAYVFNRQFEEIILPMYSHTAIDIQEAQRLNDQLTKGYLANAQKHFDQTQEAFVRKYGLK